MKKIVTIAIMLITFSACKKEETFDIRETISYDYSEVIVHAKTTGIVIEAKVNPMHAGMGYSDEYQTIPVNTTFKLKASPYYEVKITCPSGSCHFIHGARDYYKTLILKKNHGGLGWIYPD